MNRRDFLKMLGVGLPALAAPKFIFDMGANLWRRDPQVLYFENVAFHTDPGVTLSIEYFDAELNPIRVTKRIFPDQGGGILVPAGSVIQEVRLIV